MLQYKKITLPLASAFSALFIGTLSANAMAEASNLAVIPAEAGTTDTTAITDDVWSVHGQFTYVNQWHPGFHAPYSGANSMDPNAKNSNTTDVTLFLGRRLWDGAEFWINPEYDQGYGLSNTLGMAGYASGEAYKVGQNTPYLRLPRAFLRQTINLGGDAQTVEEGTNQFAGNTTTNNVVITVGRFAVVDIFDTNTYAHDPRSDFLNWSIIDSGSFDYAADSWGFTNGAAVEWNQGNWTLRGGAFELSATPNGKVTGFHPRNHSFITELERRYQWNDHPGKIKLLAFVNQGDMGSYRDATALALANGSTPDTAQVRHYSTNPGVTLNLEQELTSDLGAFARLGWNGGKKEAYEFTDINRSVSGGFVLQGQRWGREDDRIGLAGAVNYLSSDARAYFASGGMGILVGDGALNYAPEKIVEAYYALAVTKKITLTFDYQRVVNPAYNHDRGPFPIYSLRLHAEL
ncbi:high affinity Mn2+ porin [Herbaspirillum sp. Sphag1AN]|uniref:carbohydrate porin n=1 Tax=unclassified Herbaspirillum TaxID=2624150 RepID=UPI00183C98F9|nr:MULTISPECIES: carbohydrate porin [unclassified Herbaspirillum]MBB3213197.1 high affinity Mn2+ porin [Herbaspirillum sp. Sphag1AN]MBB3246394.1 high affinity Mn2+ porin [Herbaspirillum sp. Sphag64]